jgi:UDP-3-O-[3-hydroxymyristoyl] glucosamine N-acyltransferase
MPCYKVCEIASKLGLEYIGNGEVNVCRISPPEKATENDIVFLENEKSFRNW